MTRPRLSLAVGRYVDALLAVILLLQVPAVLPAQEADRVKYERNRITFDEIDSKAADAQSAYEIVQRLRPHFLHLRGGTGPATQRARQQMPQSSRREPVAVGVQVIIEGGRRGSATLLKEITAPSVLEISYLSGSEATTRYGTGYEGGVIIVKVGIRP
jgi:hypothetical protein